MIVQELITKLDHAVSANHQLPGFLEQEVIVKVIMQDADLLFALYDVELPVAQQGEIQPIILTVKPRLLSHADQDTIAAAPDGGH